MNLNFFDFYWRVVLLASSHSLEIAHTIIFVLLIAFGLISYYRPGLKLGKLPVTPDHTHAWEAAAIVLGGSIVVRLVLAPYWVWQEEHEAATVAKQELFDITRRQTAINSRPQYLKNIAIGDDPGDIPSWVGGVSTITVDRLRVFVDYSTYRGGWMPKTRAKIGEISDAVKDQYVRLPLIYLAANLENAGPNDLWWGDPHSNHPIPPPELGYPMPVTPVRARIVIVGPSGDEQHFYFMLVRSATVQNGYRFGILPQRELDFVADWENEAVK